MAVETEEKAAAAGAAHAAAQASSEDTIAALYAENKDLEAALLVDAANSRAAAAEASVCPPSPTPLHDEPLLLLGYAAFISDSEAYECLQLVLPAICPCVGKCTSVAWMPLWKNSYAMTRVH